MHVGIIGGTGPEGRGLAARLSAAGLTTLVGSREPDRARETVRAIQRGDTALPLEGVANAEAVARGDLLFLAVPFAHAAAIIETYQHQFRAGTVLVDVTVPVAFAGGVPMLVELPEGSAAEFVRGRLPPEVRLAAALKTIPASVLEHVDVPLECDDFVCGDSPEARAATIDILKRIPGLRPIDIGGLDAARTLERMAVLAIGINKRYRIRGARFRVVGL